MCSIISHTTISGSPLLSFTKDFTWNWRKVKVSRPCLCIPWHITIWAYPCPLRQFKGIIIMPVVGIRVKTLVLPSKQSKIIEVVSPIRPAPFIVKPNIVENYLCRPNHPFCNHPFKLFLLHFPIIYPNK